MNPLIHDVPDHTPRVRACDSCGQPHQGYSAAPPGRTLCVDCIRYPWPPVNVQARVLAEQGGLIGRAHERQDTVRCLALPF